MASKDRARPITIGVAGVVVQAKQLSRGSSSTGSARQWGDQFAQGEIISLDRRGLNLAPQTLRQQPGADDRPLAQLNDR